MTPDRNQTLADAARKTLELRLGAGDRVGEGACGARRVHCSVIWADGKLIEAQIKSTRHGKLNVRVADGRNFKIHGADVESVAAKAGVPYKITLSE